MAPIWTKNGPFWTNMAQGIPGNSHSVKIGLMPIKYIQADHLDLPRPTTCASQFSLSLHGQLNLTSWTWTLKMSQVTTNTYARNCLAMFAPQTMVFFPQQRVTISQDVVKSSDRSTSTGTQLRCLACFTQAC